jgi:hypothetical protein
VNPHALRRLCLVHEDPPADVKGFPQIYNPDFHFGLCTIFQGFFCEIRQKFIVRIHPWVKNTFRWPRAYRDEAFNPLGRVLVPGMNIFSENGNDFVGRLLHEGGAREGAWLEGRMMTLMTFATN